MKVPASHNQLHQVILLPKWKRGSQIAVLGNLEGLRSCILETMVSFEELLWRCLEQWQTKTPQTTLTKIVSVRSSRSWGYRTSSSKARGKHTKAEEESRHQRRSWKTRSPSVSSRTGELIFRKNDRGGRCRKSLSFS